MKHVFALIVVIVMLAGWILAVDALHGDDWDRLIGSLVIWCLSLVIYYLALTLAEAPGKPQE